MPYKSFYHLSMEPFSNAPTSDLYFSNPLHEKILTKLQYCVERQKGLAICSGDIGCGKTMLARRLLSRLADADFHAAMLVVVHSGISADWLLQRIALQLGVSKPAKGKLNLLSQLYRRLIAIHRSGKKTVVLIDETQMLNTREVMEEFRGLLNLEIPGHKLINFIFFGLPELDQGLRIDEPLRQRVAVRCRLISLDRETSINYVKHRIRLAGGSESLFSEEALQKIYAYSGGVPRLINTVADNALFEGSLVKAETIDAQLIVEVGEELCLTDIDAVQELAPEEIFIEEDNQAEDTSLLAPSISDPYLDAFDSIINEIDP